MSKRNDRATGTVGQNTTSQNTASVSPAATAANETRTKTLDQLLAEAKAKQAEAEEAKKRAEAALALAEEAKKKAEEEAAKAKQAEKEARQKVIAEAKAAKKVRFGYVPVMTDGTTGPAYASIFLAEQASPLRKAEKRFCWGDLTGPIGDPLTPEEMAEVYPG